MGRKAIDPVIRFMQKVEKLSNDECWLYVGGKDKDGYGLFQFAVKKTIRAHRYSYEIYKGNIPDGILVCHSCDNPPCVNPKHLFLGTPKQNVEDCVKKDRRCKIRESYNIGASHPRSKITETQVLEMRSLMKDGASKKDMAKKYGISQSSAFDINCRRSWKHI